MNLGSNI